MAKRESGQIRQGDVLLIPVDKAPPEGLQTQEQVILAVGELTGHAHRLSGQVLEWLENGDRYVRVQGEAGMLQHEEHDPVPVAVIQPETTYRVIPQQETDLRGQWRKVTD